MRLGDDIRALRDRSLAELDAAHDYFSESVAAWEIVRESVTAGKTFTFRSPATGTEVSETELVARSETYITRQLAEATLQQFLSLFEGFLFDLLRLWLMAYPRSLAGRKVDFGAILDATDKEAIILLAVQKELNEVLYDRPSAWFQYLERLVKLGCPSAVEIDRIAEAKATRDALGHNRGVAGKAYREKAGTLARFAVGERIDIPEPYHREVWALLRKVVADVSDAAIAKAP